MWLDLASTTWCHRQTSASRASQDFPSPFAENSIFYRAKVCLKYLVVSRSFTFVHISDRQNDVLYYTCLLYVHNLQPLSYPHVLSGNCRVLSLDIVDQHLNLEASGQFRFTPPTHAMLAFRHALREYEEEGGLSGRAARWVFHRWALPVLYLSHFSSLPFLFYLCESDL